jgi:hypothetical protein
MAETGITMQSAWTFIPSPKSPTAKKRKIRINKTNDDITYSLGTTSGDLLSAIREVALFFYEGDCIQFSDMQETISYKNGKGRTQTRPWKHNDVIFPGYHSLPNN